MIFKKLKTIIILILSVVLLYGSCVSAEEAKGHTIYFLNHEGQVNASIFSKADMLYPGKKIVKEFYIANDNNFKCEIKTLDIFGELRDKNNTILSDPQHAYREFMDNVKINFYSDDRKYFNGNAEDFLKSNLLNNQSIFIDKKSKKKFTIEIEMDMKADNSTMNLQYIFTLSTNIFGDEVNNGNLVQTGSRIDTNILIIIGTIIVLSGVLLYILYKKDYSNIKEKIKCIFKLNKRK